jgi:hypothetical protein
MKKFKLKPDPTFNASVPMPVPGSEPAEIFCTFRHRSREEMAKLVEDRPEDADFVMAMLTGWDLEDEFSRDNVERLLGNYQAAAIAISKVYFAELQKGRRES